MIKFGLKHHFGDCPGGPVAKNLSCNAGDAGSIPGQGMKIPHAMGQLSPRATTTEPVPQLESPHAATKTQHNQKIRINK